MQYQLYYCVLSNHVNSFTVQYVSNCKTEMLLLSKLKISGFICDIVIRFVKQIVKNSFFADYEDHQHSYHHETNTHSTLKHVFMCTCRCIYIFIHTSFCLLGFSSITYHHGCFLPLHHRYLFTLVSYKILTFFQ